MFSSLNDLKINTTNYIELYKENFEHLIKQKNKDRTHKIDQIMSEIRDKKIFQIDGSDDFKEQVNSNIRKLLEVKPGRALIKELTKSVSLFQYKVIHIKSGDRAFNHNNGAIDINFNKNSDDNYNALSELNKLTCSKPKAVILAHELIHELHKREQKLQADAKVARRWQDSPPDFLKNIEIYPDPTFHTCTFEGFENELIFKNLSNLEEEHTILGVNIAMFLKKKCMNKLDVLSENSFLCAFNLLPRIDHQLPTNDLINENIQTQGNLSSYYQWLEEQLNERNESIDKKVSKLLLRVE